MLNNYSLRPKKIVRLENVSKCFDEGKYIIKDLSLALLSTKTEAESWYNNQKMEYPLVYNAGFSVMTRNVKDAVVTTLILGLFGVILTLITGEQKKDKLKTAPAVFEKVKRFYSRYRLLFGGLLTVGIVAVLFFYVYDTQIRIVMNTTERAEVISVSSTEEPEILTFAEAEDEIIQIVKCKEETLTGLGVMISVPEGAVPTGTLAARVTDLNSGEVLSENILDMANAIDGEYINFLFIHFYYPTSLLVANVMIFS